MHDLLKAESSNVECMDPGDRALNILAANDSYPSELELLELTAASYLGQRAPNAAPKPSPGPSPWHGSFEESCGIQRPVPRSVAALAHLCEDVPAKAWLGS